MNMYFDIDKMCRPRADTTELEFKVLRQIFTKNLKMRFLFFFMLNPF